MTATITPIPAFDDNYIWLLETSANNQVAVVDPGDAAPVLAELKARNLELAAIFITHHHWDHTGGIDALLEITPVPVYGPYSENISQITHPLKEGDRIEFNGLEFHIIEVPGHTLDHIAYFAPSNSSSAPILFCGDTLFAGGCGRLFEGTPKQLHDSLQRLSKLPEETQVFCTHEYTLANLAFASHVDPNNVVLQKRISRDTRTRQSLLPTLPSSIKLEKQTNPFIRCADDDIIASITRHYGSKPSNSIDSFGRLRQWKDNFVI